MKKTNWLRHLTFATLALALTLATFTPAGQQMSCQVLEAIGASSGSSDGRYEIKITLVYENDRCFVYQADLTSREYSEVKFHAPDVVKDFVNKAKKKLAKKLCYFDQLYGDDVSQITRVKVQEVKIKDNLTGNSQTVDRV